MVVKTITVTEEAYNVLKSIKTSGESFTEAILRTHKKNSLREFIGILSAQQGKALEHAIKEGRKRRNAAHQKRMNLIRKAFQENHGSS